MTSKRFWTSLSFGLATEALTVGLFFYGQSLDWPDPAVVVIALLHVPALVVFYTVSLPLQAALVVAVALEVAIWTLNWWLLLSLFFRDHSELIRLRLSSLGSSVARSGD